MKKLLRVVGVPLFVAACSMAPEYQRPEMPVAPHFPAQELTEQGMEYAYNIGWREYFKDPRLQEYIGLALEHNRDLRMALLNVEAARLAHRITEADRLPGVNAGAGSARTKSPESGIPGASRYSTNYNVNVGVSAFELDFFGRVKSLSDAALNQYLSTVEGQKAAHIAIVAQVARSYMTEQLASEQLALAKNTLAANQASYNLVKQQVDAGIANDLDLAQALGQVHTARVEVAVYERQQAIAQNALAELVGTKLPEPAHKRIPLRSHSLLKALPGGIPSEVLLVRPDVLAAEYELKAENANIGAARAAFFPNVTLTTTTGTVSRSFSDLFSSGSSTWNFSPSLTLPIFNWGKLKSNLELSEVRKNIAVANYEKSIQTAFREVADGLVSREPLERQLQAQRSLVATTSEQLRLANLLYTNGIANYLDVLDAQRTLFSARQALLKTYYDQIMNSIALYSALGGGLVE